MYYGLFYLFSYSVCIAIGSGVVPCALPYWCVTIWLCTLLSAQIIISVTFWLFVQVNRAFYLFIFGDAIISYFCVVCCYNVRSNVAFGMVDVYDVAIPLSYFVLAGDISPSHW